MFAFVGASYPRFMTLKALYDDNLPDKMTLEELTSLDEPYDCLRMAATEQNLTKAQKRALVTETDDGFRLTRLGREFGDKVLSPNSDLAEVIEGEFSEFLSAVPDWDEREDIPELDVLRESTVYVDTDEEAITNRKYRQSLTETSKIREVVGLIADDSETHQMIDDLEAEYFYTSRIKTHIKNDDYLRRQARRFQEEGRGEYWEIEDELPFDVTVTDNEVILWTYQRDFNTNDRSDRKVMLIVEGGKSEAADRFRRLIESKLDDLKDRGERIEW